jgi:hypothetical protein
MDAQRLTAEGASRPLSVPAGSYLDDEGVCFLPGFASGGLDCVRRPGPREVRHVGQTDRGLERPWNLGARSAIVT